MNTTLLSNTQCECGACKLTLSHAPKGRFFCHCKICQKVYKKPYSDVSVMDAQSVIIAEGSPIEYSSYWSGLKRGTCKKCGQPVVALLTQFPLLKIAFVPTNTIGESVRVPDSQAHIFYHRRVNDMGDNLPKVSGFIQSELKATGIILPALR